MNGKFNECIPNSYIAQKMVIEWTVYIVAMRDVK